MTLDFSYSYDFFCRSKAIWLGSRFKTQTNIYFIISICSYTCFSLTITPSNQSQQYKTETYTKKTSYKPTNLQLNSLVQSNQEHWPGIYLNILSIRLQYKFNIRSDIKQPRPRLGQACGSTIGIKSQAHLIHAEKGVN